jgi:hypothetical protein
LPYTPPRRHRPYREILTEVIVGGITLLITAVALLALLIPLLVLCYNL